MDEHGKNNVANYGGKSVKAGISFGCCPRYDRIIYGVEFHSVGDPAWIDEPGIRHILFC